MQNQSVFSILQFGTQYCGPLSGAHETEVTVAIQNSLVYTSTKIRNKRETAYTLEYHSVDGQLWCSKSQVCSNKAVMKKTSVLYCLVLL